MKFIKVTHKKGKHLSDLKSMLYVLGKMAVSHSAFVYVQVGNGFKVDVPDWQKVGGWKNRLVKKESETLAAIRYYADNPEGCKYQRFSSIPSRFYVSDERVGEGGFMNASIFISRKEGEWIPCMPWVEGIEDGSTLDKDVYYYVHIDTFEYVWDVWFNNLVNWVDGLKVSRLT